MDLIDQFAEGGVVDLGISGGEPMLRKDIFEIVAHARRRGMSVGLGSNGTTVTVANARRLAAAGLNRLQVSLDGLRESHDRLRRWPGLFARVLEALRIAAEAGLRTHVCCTINRLNFQEIEPFAAFVSQLGVQRVNFSRYVPTGRGTDTLDLEQSEWQKVACDCVAIRYRLRSRIDVVTHLAQQILVDSDVREMPGFTGCQAGAGQGCVTAEGAVLPCVLLPVRIGNVRLKPFLEIWTSSPVIRALQDRGRLEGACGGCFHQDRCGGCRAVAFAKTGNYLATDSRCWLPAAQPSQTLEKGAKP